MKLLRKVPQKYLLQKRRFILFFFKKKQILNLFLYFSRESQKPTQKNEKDKLNSKERTSRLLRHSDKEALQCRANSLKRAVHDIIEHPEKDKPMKSSRRFSLRVDNLKSRFNFYF